MDRPSLVVTMVFVSPPLGGVFATLALANQFGILWVVLAYIIGCAIGTTIVVSIAIFHSLDRFQRKQSIPADILRKSSG